MVKIGCNTLYPEGRLQGDAMFTLPHQLRAVEIIAEAGFDAVEFSHAAQFATADLEKIAAHTRSLGLIPWSLHAWQPLARDASQVEMVLERYRDTAEKARALGVRIVVVHSGGGMEPEALAERRSANSKTLCALAEYLGPEITVAVENMRAHADWEFLVDMVSHCEMENIGLNIDTGHANIGDLGVVNAIHMAGNRIRTTHLQDNYGECDNHLPPGKGKIDWVAALSAFRAVGYPGPFIVEISDCPPEREPDAVADTRTAARNLRGFLRQVGFEA